MKKGRFTIVIPGSISQFVFKCKGNPIVFVTFHGAFMTERDARLVYDVADKATVILPADLATPLLEILDTSINRFYNLEDLDPEFTTHLFETSCVSRKRARDEEEERKRIDERLLQYEEEQKAHIRRLHARLSLQ